MQLDQQLLRYETQKLITPFKYQTKLNVTMVQNLDHVTRLVEIKGSLVAIANRIDKPSYQSSSISLGYTS